MFFDQPPGAPTPLRAAINTAYRMDEADCVAKRAHAASLSPASRKRIAALAAKLVQEVRRRRIGTGGIDAFMHEYELSSREGVVLMCLAEALLRIPDAQTADRLIKDKIGGADWQRHLGHSESLFVNASTWALMLTGRVIGDKNGDGDWASMMGAIVARSGEPVVRQAITQAMRILGRQFVMGRTIGEALGRAQEGEKRGYRHSYDMLGEAACTRHDAEHYFDAYSHAIAAIGAAAGRRGPVVGPSVSVKLSALHPRFEFAQHGRVMAELAPRLLDLARQARAVDIGLTVDAEEADRLDVTLDVFEAVARDAGLKGWDGFGFVIQAYQKRALPQVDWLIDLARACGRRLMVRLVKGAYWDSEIKRAQVAGLDGYPVFTRKASTDVSYLACAKALMAAPEGLLTCAYATHNPHTLAAVLEMAGDRRDFEFQRLHGMGEALYDQVVGPDTMGLACRVYAPVGGHEELLAYLVRRLLENGANTSFVNRIVDEALPVEEIIADPVARVAALPAAPHPRIPLPADLYAGQRRNSSGVDLTDVEQIAPLKTAMEAVNGWHARPLTTANARTGAERAVYDPADRRRQVGTVTAATPELARAAVEVAHGAHRAWDLTPAGERAQCLARAAGLFEENMAELMALCVREAGKTLPDAVAEVREATDFLRYYAQLARAGFAAPQTLPGPTGERNELSLHGRGVFLCISPWNFPLAIFTGQVAAALAAGNTVLAKPAHPTPLIAARAVVLMHEAGVPHEALHLLPGRGSEIGGALLADSRIAGVAMTGAIETAQAINQALAARDGPIAPLIAETGGQNAMIVDSSALPEQVTRDVLTSAFQSAGQRCSALRVLFLQEDVAASMIHMIAGAMDELCVGDPGLLATDVGPVINDEAKKTLEAHAARMTCEAKLIRRLELGPETKHGSFVAPCAFEIDGIGRLEREMFGPVLHIVRYQASRLDQVIDAINATGYGLTLGVHSRIDATVRRVQARARVGNLYVNRNQIGAVVGVQPFGGEGLSGTGPKAGGPNTLTRFAVERTVSVDTTAGGGNAALLAMEE